MSTFLRQAQDKLLSVNKKGLALRERSESKGFTLVELLVVISIIGILSVIGMAAYNGTLSSGRDVKRKADVDSIATAYETSFNIKQSKYRVLRQSDFSKGSHPTPPEGGNYQGLLSEDNTNFLICAKLEGYRDTCPTQAADADKMCYCRPSVQGPSPLASVPTGGGGGSPLPPSPPPSPPPSSSPIPASTAYKRVFVTATAYDGNLKTAGSGVNLGTATNGLEGGDKICQSRANVASLGGTWKAWLSNQGTSAASRLTHHTEPYKLLNGATIANNWTDLTDGSLLRALDVNEYVGEFALTLSGSSNPWTGTKPNGDLYTSADLFLDGLSSLGQYNCDGWTRNDSIIDGRVGSVISTDSEWTKFNRRSCGTLQKLYCFEFEQ